MAFEETALAAIPIVSRGRLEGVVILDDVRGPRSFDAEWTELATAMVAQVGLSIANARLYESLRNSYDELAATRAEMVKRERLAALGELAAIVAHEVRNPVGVIYNASSSIQRILEGSKDGATLVDIVREECERLNQIVGDLLDFARPKQLSLQPEEIPRLLAEVVEALGETPGIRVEVSAPDGFPLVVVRSPPPSTSAGERRAQRPSIDAARRNVIHLDASKSSRTRKRPSSRSRTKGHGIPDERPSTHLRAVLHDQGDGVGSRASPSSSASSRTTAGRSSVRSSPRGHHVPLPLAACAE